LSLYIPEKALVGHTPAGGLCGKIVLLYSGDTVIDFGTIAYLCQAEAIPAATRPLLTRGFEPWWARRSTRAYTEQGAPHYVRSTPAVSLVILVVGLVLLFGSNFNVVLPLIATDVLQVGARGFGFLSAAFGVGSLISALWLAWGNQQPTIRRVLIGTLVFGVLDAVFAVSRIYPLSLALIASVGGAEIAFATLAITTLQTVAPDHLRGRVMSVSILFFDGSVPLGYLLMGWLAGRYGAPSALLIGAVLSLLVAGTGWIWRKPAEKNVAASAPF
jgi:MFS family permease